MSFLPRAVATALLLGLLIPASASARKPDHDVKTLKHLVSKQVTAMKPKLDAVVDAFDSYEKEVTPCIQRHEDDLKAAGDAAATRVGTVFMVDGMHAMLAPFGKRAPAIARALDRVRLHDPKLRRWARYKARELRLLLAAPDIDFCAALDAWAAAGYDGWQMPPEVKAVLSHGRQDLEAESNAYTEKAFEALVRHGLNSRQSMDLLTFPVYFTTPVPAS